MVICPAMSELEPIRGGYCVKRVDEEHCIDLMRMLFNWRVVLTERRADEPHLMTAKGYCYFGTGKSTMLRALFAAKVWDAEGDPEGYDKRAF